MNTLLLIILAIIVLSILILVHELGHFLAAKKAGIWVEEFGIGLPPRVFGKKIGETIYSINLLPIGGFVRLHGESIDNLSKSKRAYLNKPKNKRAFVAVAGIVMNFVLAVVCFSIIYSFSGIPKESGKVSVLEVDSDSPARVAGLEPGDIISKIDGERVETSNEFAKIVSAKKGQKVELEVKVLVEDNEITKKVSIIPRLDYPKEQGPLGITISSAQIFYPPLWQRPILGLYWGVKETIAISKAVVLGFASIFMEISEGEVPKGIVGPVGITALLAHIAKLGILPLINFVGLISVNLALLNLIPFPPLDGSRIVFVIAETFFGKKVLPKVESTLNTIGMILLILLVLALTGREIPKLISSGSLSGFIDTILPAE